MSTHRDITPTFEKILLSFTFIMTKKEKTRRKADGMDYPWGATRAYEAIFHEPPTPEDMRRLYVGRLERDMDLLDFLGPRGDDCRFLDRKKWIRELLMTDYIVENQFIFSNL